MRVGLVWHKKSDRREDDILSVYERPVCREILQLRRPANSGKNCSWYVRSCLLSDSAVDEIFGKKWYYETLHGFKSVLDFRRWLGEKVDVD